MKRIPLAVTWLTVLTMPVVLHAQGNMDDVQIRTKHVAGNVYMLTGRGGNIGVSAGEDGLMMVDDQYAPLSVKIKAALSSLRKGKLEFVLNTHWHGDHTGGNPFFGRDAHIIAHNNVRRRLATAQQLFGRTVGPLPKEGLPIITFEDALSLHFNGEEVKIFHFPHGHTDGDSIVFFTRSNVIHMGDHYFNGMFPFIDLDHGGDVVGLTHNIRAVLNLASPGAKLIPGHGPLADLDDLENYHAMLVATTGLVQSAITDGKSLEEIQKAGVPARWRSWEGGFIKTDKWLATIHESLTRDD